MNYPNDGLGGVADLADILGIGERQIQKLKNRTTKSGNPVIVSPSRGKYDLLASAAGYIEFIKDDEDGTDNDGKHKDPQKRLMAAKASMAEREDALEAGSVIKTDEVEQALVETISLLASHIDAIPGRMSGTIVGLTGEPKQKIYALLKQEADDIRQAISNGLEDFINTQEIGASDAAAADEERMAVGGS